MGLAQDVAAQGNAVRDLKAAKASKEDIKAAVDKLLSLKKQLEVKMAELNKEKDAAKAHRAGFEDVMLRKFFYVPSFEIYGGVAGLYDFGPPGCAVKANLQALWKKHFILEENMLEMSCASLTPEVVLKTSGHVEKFTDFMVKDEKTGECYRADKLLEEHVDEVVGTASPEEKKELLAAKSNADAYSQQELGEALTKFGVKAPGTGNDICAPFPYNLMFQTQIGPTGKSIGYMRPETAQGMFCNFRRLLEYNGGRMPFAAAQLGLGFRNEISPRSGLLRVREFPMAEIEHFVNPADKSHPKFAAVSGHVFNLLAKEDQTGEDITKKMTAGEAVEQKIIDNETLAYFMIRTHLFLVKAGVINEKLRFRQHKDTEMAHYASDCWDAEIHTTYGWVECVGHADRAAYDLRVHSNKSKTDLSAQQVFDKPKTIEVATVKPNKGKIGKVFRGAAKVLLAHLEGLERTDALALKEQLASGPVNIKLCTGEEFEVAPDMVNIQLETKKVSVEKFLPGVIEPAFGIGRVIYAILEHSYAVREKNGEKQGILKLNPIIAPVKVAMLPIGGTPEFYEITEHLEQQFISLSLSSKVDTSGASIGRKYARADEIGVPFGVTIDFDSIKDPEKNVTIRDRDTTTQIRVPLKLVPKIIHDLIIGRMAWKDAYNKFPKFGV